MHGPQSPPPSPRWPTRAIVAAALLLAVSAIVLVTRIGTDRRDEGAGRAPAAAVVQRDAESPATAVVPRMVASSTPPRPSRGPAVAASVAVKPVDERSQVPAPPAQTSRRAVSSRLSPTKLPALISVAPAPVVPEPAAIPLPPQTGGGIPPPATPAAIPAATPAPTPAPAPAPGISPVDVSVAPAVASPEPLPAVSAAEELPPADSRVLEIAELPAPIRAALPKLLVSGHVWSEEPSLRLLSVDDRLLREGGAAAPGVSLQEITPAGAVFVFKGWHFRVGGGRP